MKPAQGNPWLAYRRPRPAARLRLFCLPYAGGAASIYRTWPQELPETIDVCPLQLPGREQRLREQAYTRVPPLVEALAGAISPMLDEMPFAFFGHSMGGLLSYELAQHLRATSGKRPVHLLVSARRAPQLPPEDKHYWSLPDDELKDKLREIEGTPQEVLDHDELMELMLPLIRADFELNDTYQPTDHPPLDCPIDAFGGTADPEVEREDLEAWAELTTGPFRLRMFPGGHFFLHPEKTSLIAAVTRCLAPHLD